MHIGNVRGTWPHMSPAAALPTCLLALSEADQPMLLWWVIGAVLVIGQGLQGWIAALQYFRGQKMDPATYVTRAEFQAAKAERDRQLSDTIGTMQRQLSDVAAVVREISRDLPAIHRALGRLEGHDEAVTPR